MIKLDVTYSDYVNTTDPKYPAGKAVDASGEENTDGTPLLAKWMNDINGTRQAIIKEAFGDMSGISGVPDDVENSDVLKAIKKITQEYTNQKFIDYYKNGYIQWPGMPSPLEDTSMHYEGYSWHEVNYDGNFFRSKGRNAKAFSSKKLTKEQIKNGDYIFQEDEQGDAIREIEGEFQGSSMFHFTHAGSFKGAFELKELEAPNALASYPSKGSAIIGFKASKAEGVTTAEENRPRSLTFIYWVLAKNE